jgi:hypothetical protein
MSGSDDSFGNTIWRLRFGDYDLAIRTPGGVGTFTGLPRMVPPSLSGFGL